MNLIQNLILKNRREKSVEKINIQIDAELKVDVPHYR